MPANFVEQFVSELIVKAGLDKVPENFKKEYAEKISAEVERRIGLVAIKELNSEALDKFDKLMEADTTPDKLADFFQKNIPDYESKISAALKDFADEFLASANKLKQAAA